MIILFTYEYMGYLMYYSAFILWFDNFLDSGAEFCQIFRWFYGKFKIFEDLLKLTDLWSCDKFQFCIGDFFPDFFLEVHNHLVENYSFLTSVRIMKTFQNRWMIVGFFVFPPFSFFFGQILIALVQLWEVEVQKQNWAESVLKVIKIR